MLSLRPYPKKTERLNEYLMHLACINGFFKLTEFHKKLGVNVIKQAGMGLWSEHHLVALNDALSKALGRSCIDVIALHQRTPDVDWLFAPDRTLAELVVDFPRICLPCVKENEEMDWRWSLGTVARCPIHNAPLVDNCPSCGAKLVWDTRIFDLCPKCKIDWRQLPIKTENLEPLSELESLFWPDEDGFIKATSHQLKLLTRAIYVAARPFDAMIQPYSRIPYSQNYYQLVLNGLKLLSDEAYRASWSVACDKYWKRYPSSIRPDTQFAVYTSLTLASEPNESFESESRTAFIQKARVQYVSQHTEDDPIYHVNASTLAKALNISVEDIIVLLESRVFPMVNKSYVGNHKMMKSKIFNLKNIIKLISPFINGPEPNTDYIELTKETKLLTYNLCPFGHLLGAVIEKQCAGYFASPFNLNRVFVSNISFKKWIKEFYKTRCCHPISIAEVASALDITNDDIKQLVYAEELKWAKHTRRGEFIDGETFYQYRERANQHNASLQPLEAS